MPNTVRAAADGMPSISRRKALAATGTALTAALVGLAAPAAAGPAAKPERPKAPVERVNELARELAHAMDDWMKDLDGDHWVAHVHPASYSAFPIGFENVDAVRRHRPEIEQLYAEWCAVCDEPGEVDADDNYRRYSALWDRITKATPTTVRELAMQIVVVTDDNQSIWLDEFYERLKLLTKGSA